MMPFRIGPNLFKRGRSSSFTAATREDQEGPPISSADLRRPAFFSLLAAKGLLFAVVVAYTGSAQTVVSTFVVSGPVPNIVLNGFTITNATGGGFTGPFANGGWFAPYYPYTLRIQPTASGDYFNAYSLDVGGANEAQPAGNIRFTGSFLGGGSIVYDFPFSGGQAFQTANLSGFTNLAMLEVSLAPGFNTSTGYQNFASSVPVPEIPVVMALLAGLALMGVVRRCCR